MKKIRSYMTKLAVALFLGMTTGVGAAFAQTTDPGSTLGISGWKGDIGTFLKNIAGWLQWVLAAGTLAAIVFAVMHGIGIMKATDPRERNDKIKGLAGWIVGVLIMFLATTLTAVLYNMTQKV